MITQITYDPAKIESLYCVYSHEIPQLDPNDVTKAISLTVWIGHCKYNEFLLSPDARRNSEWTKHVRNAMSVTVKVLSVHATAVEASNAAFALVRVQRPHCNVHGHQPSRVAPVECLDTGEIFETASAAALFYGMSQSAMSNHLRGRIGYKTVHGKTFRRVS